MSTEKHVNPGEGGAPTSTRRESPSFARRRARTTSIKYAPTSLRQEDVIAVLKEILGDERVLEGEQTKRFDSIWTEADNSPESELEEKKKRHQSLCVIQPRNAEELERILKRFKGIQLLSDSFVSKIANLEYVQFVVRAGATGATGQPVADDTGSQVVISTELMKDISYNRDERTVTVGAGVTVAELNKHLRGFKVHCPISVGKPEKTTVVGEFVTRASGPDGLKRRTMQDFVVGSNTTTFFGGMHNQVHVRKRVVGPNVTALLSGTQGSFGVTDSITLKCVPDAPYESIAYFQISRENDTADIVDSLKRKFRGEIDLLELLSPESVDLAKEMPDSLYTEVIGDPNFFRKGKDILMMRVSSTSSKIAEDVQDELERLASEESRKKIFNVKICNEKEREQAVPFRKQLIEGTLNQDGYIIHNDLSLPLSEFSLIEPLKTTIESLYEYDERFKGMKLSFPYFGHIGDGGLHFTVVVKNAANYSPEILSDFRSAVKKVACELVTGVGGNVSSEHGVGPDNRDIILHSLATKYPAFLEFVRRLEKTLDPHCQLNPLVKASDVRELSLPKQDRPDAEPASFWKQMGGENVMSREGILSSLEKKYPGQVITDITEKRKYEVDENEHDSQRKHNSLCVLVPKDEENLVQMLQELQAIEIQGTEKFVEFVPQGGTTKKIGRSIVDGSGNQIIISMKRFKEIKIDRKNRTVTVGAAVTVDELNDALRDARVRVPFLYGNPEHATVIGRVATQANGGNALQKGHFVMPMLDCKLATFDGVVETGNRAKKRNIFIDWPSLVAGTHGALGPIPSATFDFSDAPILEYEVTAFFKVTSENDLADVTQRINEDFAGGVELVELLSPDTRIMMEKSPRYKNVFGEHEFEDGNIVMVRIHSNREDLRDRVEQTLQELVDGTHISSLKICNAEEASHAYELRRTYARREFDKGSFVITNDINLPMLSFSITTTLMNRIDELVHQKYSQDGFKVEYPFFGHVGDERLLFNVVVKEPQLDRVSPESDVNKRLLEFRKEVKEIIAKEVHPIQGNISPGHCQDAEAMETALGEMNDAHIQVVASLEATVDPFRQMCPQGSVRHGVSKSKTRKVDFEDIERPHRDRFLHRHSPREEASRSQ